MAALLALMKRAFFLSANGVSNASADISFVVLSVLLSVVLVLLGVWLLTKFMRRPKYAEVYAARLKAYDAAAAGDKPAKPVKFNFTGIVLAIIGIGIVVRAAFMLTVTGYREEIKGLFDLMMNASPAYEGGVVGHYPLVTGIYWILGSIARAAGLTADSLGTQILVKLPLIVADGVLMYMVYRAAKKHINEYAGLVLAGFVAFFPPFILASGVWGSVYSLLALFLVMTFYFMANKKFLLMMVSYALALYTAKDALYLFPLIAVFVIYQWVKALRYARTQNVRGFKNTFLDKDARPVMMLPVYLIASFFVMWLTVLPLLRVFSSNPFMWLFVFYLKPLGTFSLFGYNATPSAPPDLRELAEIIQAYSAATDELRRSHELLQEQVTQLTGELSRKNRANLVYLAGYILLTLSVYFLDFTAMNLVAVLALLLLGVIFVRDRRILLITGLLGLIFTLNGSLIMMQTGYLNSLPAESFETAAYTGIRLFDSGGWLAANIVVSAAALLIHAYATIVILDIAMSNKRKLFAELPEPVKFGQSLKKFIKD